MNSSVRGAVVALGLLVEMNVSMAQPQVFHTVSWTEVITGTNTPVANPNGTIDLGEAARIDITMSFTPVGTLAPYYLPAPGGIAPIAGFRHSIFRVNAINALGGSWSQPIPTPGFLAFLEFSAEFCSLRQAEPEPPPPTNPVMWTAVWSPSSYVTRVASFRVQRIIAEPTVGLWVDLGPGPTGQLFGIARATGVYDGGVQVPIVPAPAPGAAILVLLLTTPRRRVARPVEVSHALGNALA